MLDRLVHIILPNRAADNGMNAGGERAGRRGPIAQRDGHRDHPLPGRHPRDHLFHQMRPHLGHAPSSTGGTKSPLLAAESEQHRVWAGVTAQPHKAMRQDAALQGGVKLFLHILGQPSAVRIGREGGQKRFEVLGNHLVEHCVAGVSRLVCRGDHILALLSHRTSVDRRA